MLQNLASVAGVLSTSAAGAALFGGSVVGRVQATGHCVQLAARPVDFSALEAARVRR
jgi:hypothetical protein